MVDEIIDNDTSNNNNVLPADTKDIITMHDYDTCKEIVNITSTRSGQNDLLLRGLVKVIQNSFNQLKRFGGTAISAVITITSKIIGYLVIKVTVANRVYADLKMFTSVIKEIIFLEFN